jgi:hypothetical protein
LETLFRVFDCNGDNLSAVVGLDTLMQKILHVDLAQLDITNFRDGFQDRQNICTVQPTSG